MDLFLTHSRKSANLKPRDYAKEFKKCGNLYQCKPSSQPIRIDHKNKWL